MHFNDRSLEAVALLGLGCCWRRRQSRGRVRAPRAF